MRIISAVIALVTVGALAGAGLAYRYGTLGAADMTNVRERVTPKLTKKLKGEGLTLGAPVFIRIFKESSELEMWVKKGERFAHFKTYPICTFSGGLGPKLKEGDGQAPEGFYEVRKEQLNPSSRYHLSFNLGFPNAYDKAHNRTGSFLMVHGNCVSVGCYAMTDALIEEIYLLVEAALEGGQAFVPVHAFPFRMTDNAMQAHNNSEWMPFWQNLKEGYDAFDATHFSPTISILSKKYILLK